MENTVKAQREQILSDWRNHLSLDEFRLLVAQVDSLIELAREEGGLTQLAPDGAYLCGKCGRMSCTTACQNCGHVYTRPAGKA